MKVMRKRWTRCHQGVWRTLLLFEFVVLVASRVGVDATTTAQLAMPPPPPWCTSLTGDAARIVPRARAAAVLFWQGRGGAMGKDYDDNDSTDDDNGRNRPRPVDRRPPQTTKRPSSRKKSKRSSSKRSSSKRSSSKCSPSPASHLLDMPSAVAKTSLAWTATAVSATARTSGKAAYYLLQPKQVDGDELVGLWRLDQFWTELGSTDSIVVACTASGRVRVSPQGDVRDAAATGTRQQEENTTRKKSKAPADPFWTMTPARWPKPARMVLELPNKSLVYKAVVQRKWADRSVLKLKGKIYEREATGWRGRGERLVQVGTFVGRRRLRLEPDEEESEDYDEEVESEDDYEDFDEQDDVEGEEFEDDWQEDYQDNDGEEEDPKGKSSF